MRTLRTTALSAVAAGALVASTLAGTGSPAVAAPSPDLSVTNVTAHLQQLQDIANANGGNRATGKPGYLASLNWVKAKLDAVGYTTQVQSFSTSSGTSYNLVADWPGGDPEHVVMTGAHLDSVASGPGINDNGTGSAAILEAALAWAASGNTPRNHLRFAWWGAEEQGLLGSNRYMATLPTADKDRIDLYMNYDMVGSPNPGYFVYDDNPAGNGARDDVTAYYTSKGIPWEYIDVQGRSDHASFRSYGIADDRHLLGRRDDQDHGAGAEVGRHGGGGLRSVLPPLLRHDGQPQHHRAGPQPRRDRPHGLAPCRQGLRHHAAADRRQPAHQPRLRVRRRGLDRHLWPDHEQHRTTGPHRIVEGLARRQRQHLARRRSPSRSPSPRPRRRRRCRTGSAPTRRSPAQRRTTR